MHMGLFLRRGGDKWRNDTASWEKLSIGSAEENRGVNFERNIRIAFHSSRKKEIQLGWKWDYLIIRVLCGVEVVIRFAL